jgi:CPW-WPC domain-containing protein
MNFFATGSIGYIPPDKLGTNEIKSDLLKDQKLSKCIQFAQSGSLCNTPGTPCAYTGFRQTQRDYSGKCPVGWTVDGKDGNICNAPSTYTGTCNIASDIGQYTETQKEDWAQGYGTEWPLISAQLDAEGNPDPNFDPIGDCWAGTEKATNTFIQNNTIKEVIPANQVSNSIKVYTTPSTTTNCTTDDCVREKELRYVDAQIAEYQKRLNLNKTQLDTFKIYQDALKNNQTYEEALKNAQLMQINDKLEARKRELSQKKDALINEYNLIQRQKDTQSSLLFEKQEILINRDDDIRKNYEKLNDLNTKIFTVSQLIRKNQNNYRLKSRVSTTLAVLLGGFVVLAMIMLVYYAVKTGTVSIPTSVDDLKEMKMTFD